jgi:hypothetical protein
MPLLTRKRLILAKSETTYATDSSPVGADAVLVRNLEITPIEGDVVSRDLIRPYLGNYEQLLAQTRVSLTFQVELAGSGTPGTAPRYGAILKACGMSETVVAPDAGPPVVAGTVAYAPVSANFSSATIYFNNDGVLHKATGCRGSFSLNCEVGQIPTIDFTMTGIYNPPTDTVAPAVTYTNQATPQIFKAGNTPNFSMLGFSGCLQMVSFDIANEVIYRELVGCTKSVTITNRAPSGDAMIEAPTLAEKDFFAIANDDSTGSLSFQHGTNAGNIVTFTAQKVDITNPSYSDQDGIQMLSLPYVAIPTDAGNDEVSLVYS